LFGSKKTASSTSEFPDVATTDINMEREAVVNESSVGTVAFLQLYSPIRDMITVCKALFCQDDTVGMAFGPSHPG